MRVQRLAIMIITMLTALGISVARAGGETVIRVNQVGYPTDASKQAILMSSVDITDFTVNDAASDAVVLAAKTGSVISRWSQGYPNVYALDFSTLTTSGTYIIKADGVKSPPFKIDSAKNLYSTLLTNGLSYFQSQRDGEDVPPGPLNRQPSHLTDKQASAYEPPTYDLNDILVGGLKPVGGAPIDVSGGWFDAGDAVKFVQTTSFVETLMLIMVRDGAESFRAEARHGMDWLNKMWDSETKTLYYQVGIGNGNAQSILGDHDVWRLPESDDQLSVTAGDPTFYIKYRPVLRAGAPGARISPNLAGRLTAAFALCYQVFKTTDKPYADQCLRDAQTIFDLADTGNVGDLLTTAPYDFYPEFQWSDDLELGAAELYRVVSAGDLPDGLPHSDPSFYQIHAETQAKGYINNAFQDVFNLYDVAGLAHAELYRALAINNTDSNIQSTLLLNLKNQLESFARMNDQFGHFLLIDSVPHAFGVSIQASLYDELSNTDTFRDMQQHWLNWALGANAWGSTFVVGAGTTFPQCLHHQSANLTGALDGTTPLLLGAVVNGPNDPASIDDSEEPWDAQRPCPADGKDVFAPFNNEVWRYVDRVNSWSTVEPANDYTILSLMAFMRAGG